MFCYFIICAWLLTRIGFVVANWRLIDESFTELKMESNNWRLKDGCSDSSDTSFSFSTCSEN